MADKSRRIFNSYRTRLDNLIEWVDNFVENSENWVALEVRLDGLKDLNNLFLTEKNRLYPKIKDEDLDVFQLDCEQFSDHFLDTKAKIITKLNKVKPKVKDELPVNQFTPAVTVNSIKLPDIPLPKFSGPYDQWHDFKTQFEAVIINNPKLSDNDKLNYLRGCLVGDAVRDYGKDESSFALLWSALEKTYENKRWLVSKHVREIFGLKSIINPSADNLNSLLLSVQRHLRALRAIGLENNAMSEAFLIENLSMKLDPESQKD